MKIRSHNIWITSLVAWIMEIFSPSSVYRYIHVYVKNKTHSLFLSPTSSFTSFYYFIFSLLIFHSLYSDCIFKQDGAKSLGLELLFVILQLQSAKLKREASMALSMLARRANFISSLIQAISPPPIFEVFFLFTLYVCPCHICLLYFDLFSLFTESVILPYLNFTV